MTRSHKKGRTAYPPVRYEWPQPILSVMTPKRIERFWSRVDRSAGPDDCWPWRGRPGPRGYGLLQGATDYRGFSLLAHRIAFALHHQREPMPSLIIRHSCDNPPCCNPAHLLEGTHADNTADMIERGRANLVGAKGKFGAEANAARYTAEDRAQAIQLRYERRLTMKQIASMIGTNHQTISRWLAEHEASLCS